MRPANEAIYLVASSTYTDNLRVFLLLPYRRSINYVCMCVCVCVWVCVCMYVSKNIG